LWCHKRPKANHRVSSETSLYIYIYIYIYIYKTSTHEGKHIEKKKNKWNQAAIGMNNIIMIRLKDDWDNLFLQISLLQFSSVQVVKVQALQRRINYETSTNTWIHQCMYIYICVCVYTHTHTHNKWKQNRNEVRKCKDDDDSNNKEAAAILT
jgi:hypothetical protein